MDKAYWRSAIDNHGYWAARKGYIDDQVGRAVANTIQSKMSEAMRWGTARFAAIKWGEMFGEAVESADGVLTITQNA